MLFFSAPADSVTLFRDLLRFPLVEVDVSGLVKDAAAAAHAAAAADEEVEEEDISDRVLLFFDTAIKT